MGMSARRRAVTAAAAGVLAGAMSAVVVPVGFVPLIAWDVAAVVFLVLTWWRVGRLDASATAGAAEREDPTRAGADIAVLTAAVISLVAVGYVIVQAGSDGGLVEGLQVGLGVGSVIASWAVVHTVYALRYARLYYSGRDGGVDFHQAGQPCFVDFAYLAFTVGMTFQVSDTEINSTAIRGNVLRHALLSYLFGTVIVALTINLVAGLSK